METRAHDDEAVDSIYTGTMPMAADITPTQEEPNTNDGPAAQERKRYHSSAMYAASMWHNTVSHVKAHSHKALDL
jgi:hypothetical protein